MISREYLIVLIWLWFQNARTEFDVDCFEPFCKCSFGTEKAVCNGSALNYIPRLPKYVRDFTITDTNLTDIAEDGFLNLTFNHIEKLNLTRNNIGNINSKAFKNLKYLTTLVISKEPLLDVSILTKAFYSLTFLNKCKLLELSFNNWETLSSDMFGAFEKINIKEISLEGNMLQHIQGSIFSKVKKVGSLILSNNMIEEISLDGLSHIFKLFLDNNHLSKVPTWCDDSGKSKVPVLQELSLSKNNIRTIKTRSFQCLPRVNQLYLENINMDKIENNIFANMPFLTKLHLTRVGNPLKTIEKYAFNCSSLEILVLAETKYNFKPNPIFELCPQLTSLDLTGNFFPNDDETIQKVFQSVRNLQILTLAKTRLLSLPKNVFTNMPKLQTLQLHDNSISRWNDSESIFGNMTSLQYLSLRQNFISVINETSFPPQLLLRLEKLNLAKNPYSCSCDQLWFRTWIDKTNVTLDGYPRLYICRYPSTMSGRLLNYYKPTNDICKPWNPLYTMAIVMTSVLALVFVMVTITLRCQANLKNYLYLLRIHYNRRQGYLPIETEADFEYHAFVVYCDADRKWVHGELLNRIENFEGMKLCIHHRDFIVGDAITTNVDNYLNKSWKVIVVMSNNFAKSQWCQWEVDIIQERRRRQGRDAVISIMLQNIDSKHMTSQLRTLIDSTPYLRYQKGVGTHLFWKALIKALRKPLGHPPIAVT